MMLKKIVGEYYLIWHKKTENGKGYFYFVEKSVFSVLVDSFGGFFKIQIC